VRFDISYPVVSIYLVLLSKTVSGVGASFACAPLHRNGKVGVGGEEGVLCVLVQRATGGLLQFPGAEGFGEELRTISVFRKPQK
jgi:hypothetical protein